jgi:hypothetical protein
LPQADRFKSHRSRDVSFIAQHNTVVLLLQAVLQPQAKIDVSFVAQQNPVVWTEEAIANGYRSRVTEEFFILGLVQRGWLTGLGGGAFGTVGIVVNCPVVFRFL